MFFTAYECKNCLKYPSSACISAKNTDHTTSSLLLDIALAEDIGYPILAIFSQKDTVTSKSLTDLWPWTRNTFFFSQDRDYAISRTIGFVPRQITLN